MDIKNINDNFMFIIRYKKLDIIDFGIFIIKLGKVKYIRCMYGFFCLNCNI